MNKYVAFYGSKQIEVEAESMYQAQLKAAKALKARKSYDVAVAPVEIDGRQVYVDPASL